MSAYFSHPSLLRPNEWAKNSWHGAERGRTRVGNEKGSQRRKKINIYMGRDKRKAKD
jgi:hypothetical protein